MKKSYGKPLVCVENFESGEVITNSKEYAKKVKENRKELFFEEKSSFREVLINVAEYVQLIE